MSEPGICYIKQEYKTDPKPEESHEIVAKKRSRKDRRKVKDRHEVCFEFLRTGKCSRDPCRFSHDIAKIPEEDTKNLPFACVHFENYGACPYGQTCRFIHPDAISENPITSYQSTISNIYKHELMHQLFKNEYKYFKMEAICDILGSETIPAIPDHQKIDLTSKLYLAPLTTNGNLPFRRICKEFGADVTCSEMVDALSLVKGKKSEWALLKRHKSEDIFGAQIGSFSPDLIWKATELISENSDVDFIDLNMGCPIDLFFNKGAGCALMAHPKKVLKILNGMTHISQKPITVKMRTGIKIGCNTAHKMLPLFEGSGISAITLHGRSREQRYSKLADWEYIDECAKICPMPLLGNGDIMSYQDFDEKTNFKISGVMIGRGALIKPWVFTEIKEKRVWDISSKERLEIIKKYVDYGLEHWGSDTQGVEKTRCFLLEWLSFLSRYVPVGILERPPQRINQRPESFVGRDDLETLLSSRKVDDWIKISSMFLGDPKSGFQFTPKHKSTSYG